MIQLFFWTTVLFVAAAIQCEKLFVFDNDRSALLKCIEQNLSNDDDFYNVDVGVTKIIAASITKRIYGKTIKMSNINDIATRVYYCLRREKSLQFIYYQIFGVRAIRETLIYCAYEGQTYLESNTTVFDGEQREVANVLDFILVDWLIPFKDMLRTRKGRIILRRFGEEAQIALVTAMKFLGDNRRFREYIRQTWMHRAPFYFDNNNLEFSSIRHYYSVGKGLLILRDTRDAFSNQNSQNITNDSNLRVSQLAVSIFLDIHAPDRRPHMGYDMFAKYEQNGMTPAEYFIETHIDQFYRIIIFFMQLQYSGMASNDGDIYFKRRIPFAILCEESQKLLYENQIYRKILVGRRKIFKELHVEIGLILSTPYLFEKRRNSWVCMIENDATVTENSMILSTSRYYQNLFQKSIDINQNDDNYNLDYFVTSDFDENNDCSSSNRINEKNHVLMNPRPVPTFLDEPSEVSIILDYILVDWILPINYMIRNRNGRALLREYSKEALLLLKNAVDYAQNLDRFRYLLRSLWMLRAQYYFNGSDPQVPYLRHRYTIEHSFPHTYDDQNALFLRNAYHLLERNPLVSPEDLHGILNIHTKDYLYNDEKYDIYTVYEQNGMTSAQYYIETHIDQFYRILFFIKELELYGVRSDEDDIWDGPIPYDILPDFIQEIVYSDERYRNFLLFERRRLEKLFNSDQRLLTARVFEEVLILSLEAWIFHHMFDDTVYNATTIRTTDPSLNSTTTRKYDELKRKGSVWMNKKGKHFSKTPRNTFPESCCNDKKSESSSSENLYEYTKSCLLKRYNYTVMNFADYAFSVCSISRTVKFDQKQLKSNYVYYGYIFKAGPNDINIDQVFFFENEWSTITKIILDKSLS